MGSSNSAQSPIDSIPPPNLIRDRLTKLFAEARLLRGLLRLSESKDRLRTSGQSRPPRDELP
jgi:hypothetical protein